MVLQICRQLVAAEMALYFQMSSYETPASRRRLLPSINENNTDVSQKIEKKEG